MKFENIDKIIKGTRATTLVELPLMGVPVEDGVRKTAQVSLRVLTSGETTETIQFAIQYAKQRGSAAPHAGDPLYETGIRLKTLHLACLDPEHPAPDSEAARFFSSVEEIENSPYIGRDGIWFLYELQEAWQDSCSPQPSKMSFGEYWREVEQLAESSDPFYLERLRPSLRLSFARTMAVQLLAYHQAKSLSSSSTAAASKIEQKPRVNGKKSAKKRSAKRSRR